MRYFESQDVQQMEGLERRKFQFQEYYMQKKDITET